MKTGIDSVNKVRAQLKSGQIKVGISKPFKHSLAGQAGLKTLATEDIPTVLSEGAYGNPTATSLGSYTGHYTVVARDPRTRTATVRFHVENSTGLESATRFPALGYLTKAKQKELGVKTDTLENMRKIPSQFKGLNVVQGIEKLYQTPIPRGILNDHRSGRGRTINQNFEWYEKVKY